MKKKTRSKTSQITTSIRYVYILICECVDLGIEKPTKEETTIQQLANG